MFEIVPFFTCCLALDMRRQKNILLPAESNYTNPARLRATYYVINFLKLTQGIKIVDNQKVTKTADTALLTPALLYNLT